MMHKINVEIEQHTYLSFILANYYPQDIKKSYLFAYK